MAMPHLSSPFFLEDFWSCSAP